MQMLRIVLWSLVSLLGACASSGAAPGRAAMPDAAMAQPSQESGDYVSLDDVTNGLVNNASRSGAFFNDGSGEDLRESAFDAGTWGKRVDRDDPAPPRKERMLIYSGELSVEVPRAEDAGKQFLAMVEQWGGYLQSQSGTAWTVRVPAAHFDEAFAAVRAAGRVLAENRRANDVTEEFVDLGIRVDNARKSRDRLLAILEKADQVEDILKIEKELRRLTEEIERMEGRLKFLKDQVAMSTLRAEFRSVQQAPPRKRQRRWSRFGWVNRVGANAVMEGF